MRTFGIANALISNAVLDVPYPANDTQEQKKLRVHNLGARLMCVRPAARWQMAAAVKSGGRLFSHGRGFC